MLLGVFGPGYFRGHKYENYDFVARCITDFRNHYPNTQVECLWTGGGVGVEQLALRYATLAHIASDIYPPNIKAHADKAFIIRNREIIKIVSHVLILWDGKDMKYPQLMSDALDAQKYVHLRHVE